MQTTREPTAAETNRRKVRRVTKALAALAIGATAAFAAVAASNTRHAAPTVGDASSGATGGTVVQSASWDDDFGEEEGSGLYPPSQLPSQTTQPPRVTSGGS
jgi:hypothetical protein